MSSGKSSGAGEGTPRGAASPLFPPVVGEELAFVDLGGSPGDKGAEGGGGRPVLPASTLPPGSRPPFAETPPAPPPGEGGEAGDTSWVLSKARPYFACDTDEVLGRLVDPFRPWRGGAFLEEMGEAGCRGDFWGPTWLTLTLVLSLACAGNAVATFRAPRDDGLGRVRDTVDVRKVSTAWATLLGFQAVAPLAAALVLTWCGGIRRGPTLPETTAAAAAAAAADDRLPPGVPHLVSLYGYSLSPLLLASAACLVPVAADAWAWTWLGLAALLGVAFCFQNLAHLAAQGFITRSALLLCALAPHVALCFAVKILLI